MLMGHLRCGVVFAVLVCAGCVLLGLPWLSAFASLIVGANVGFGASVTTRSP